MEKLLLPIPDAGDTLGVGRSTVYQLIKTGDLRTVHIGRRALVDSESLTEYVERLRAEAS